MQETWVQYLVWEDSTGPGATKPMSHATEPTYPRASALQQQKPLQGEAHKLQLEKVHPQQQRPDTTKST